MNERALVVLRYDDGVGNFGDDLNGYLWPALLPGVPLRFVANHATESISTDDVVLVGIGTILNQRIPARGSKIVLGAGTGYLDPPIIDQSYSVLAVRGPLSAQVLGLDPSLAATDAAALLADVDVEDLGLPEMEVGVMPHHRSMDCLPWPDICAAAGVDLIDPRGDPVSIVNQVRSCRLVLAEAMHAAIVADLSGIPWIPIRLSYLVLDFKWRDWCASVELEYRPTIGPVLRSAHSWKGRVANRAARSRVVRFLRVAPGLGAVLSDRAVLAERTDRLRLGLDRARDRVRETLA